MEMTRVSTIRAWVGAVACIATALGFAASARAQQEDQANQDQSQQTDDDQDRDSGNQQEQDRQDQQDRQRSQQDQQQRESDQQFRQQRDGQSQWQSDQTQWDGGRNRQWSQQESSTWPEPNRDGFSRQGTQYQDQYDQGRQMARPGSGDEQDAGLGVNIISDRGPGVVVTRVFRGTPADEMGIQEGDRITQLNNQDVRSVNEFIGRIRNMNPGDEVELEVLRNRDEQTVRGELESRQEALLLNNRQQLGRQWQGDQNWQTGYQETGSYGFQQQGRTGYPRAGGSGDYISRLNSIEQQVSRLSRELEQIRFALQDLRQSERGFQQSGRTRESQATYDEYQGGYETQRSGTRPQSEQWDNRSDQEFRQSDRFQEGSQQRGFQGSQRDSRSSAREAAEGGTESPAGIIGGRRTRPDSDLDRLDR
jgi:hypothetical protein